MTTIAAPITFKRCSYDATTYSVRLGGKPVGFTRKDPDGWTVSVVKQGLVDVGYPTRTEAADTIARIYLAAAVR